MKYINQNTIKSGIIRLRHWLVGPNVTGGGPGGYVPSSNDIAHFTELVLDGTDADFVTTASVSWQYTGTELDFEVDDPSQIVEIIGNLSMATNNTSSTSAYCGYALDDGDVVPITPHSKTYGNVALHIHTNFTETLTGLSAGTHNLKFYILPRTGVNTVLFMKNGEASFNTFPRIQVVTFHA